MSDSSASAINSVLDASASRHPRGLVKSASGRSQRRRARLYRRVLRRFADGKPPTVSDTTTAAATRGLDAHATLDKLESADLLRRDVSGELLSAAYPFSGESATHVVRLDGGEAVRAMCAVDALGIPFMVDRRAPVVSRDGLSGEAINVDVGPHGDVRAQPASSVVSIAGRGGSGATADACCRTSASSRARATPGRSSNATEGGRRDRRRLPCRGAGARDLRRPARSATTQAATPAKESQT